MAVGVGDKIGSYEIVERIRAGGMATVFAGVRTGRGAAGPRVAIKVMHPELLEEPEAVRMFAAEARLAARIDHPNVVRVEQSGEAGGSHYLVMEYVRGRSLGQLMRACHGRIPQSLAVWIAMQIAAGLHAAHETRDEAGTLLGVVHRDISPQNVLVADDGHVKLIDFGIAKVASELHRTRSGFIKGKLRYMPPEQAYHDPLDRRADVYALGVVLWEMLTGEKLFDAQDEFQLLELVRQPVVARPGSLVADIAPALDAAVMAALAPEVDQRPVTADAFRERLAAASPAARALDAHDLAAFLRSIPSTPEPATSHDPDTAAATVASPVPFPASHRTRWIAAAIAVSAIAAVIAAAPVLRDAGHAVVPRPPVQRTVTPPAPVVVATVAPVEAQPAVRVVSHDAGCTNCRVEPPRTHHVHAHATRVTHPVGLVHGTPVARDMGY